MFRLEADGEIGSHARVDGSVSFFRNPQGSASFRAQGSQAAPGTIRFALPMLVIGYNILEP